MWLNVLILVLVVVVLLLNKFRAKLLPHLVSPANPHWFWGHLPLLQARLNDHIQEWFIEMQEEFGENTNWQLSIPFQSALIILAPNETNAKWILKDNFRGYRKSRRSVAVFKEFFGDGIFAVDGDAWAPQRKLASHMFSLRALREFMMDVFIKHGEVCVEKLEKIALEQQSDLDSKANGNDLGKAQNYLNIEDMFFRYTLTTFLEIGFGTEYDGINGDIEFARTFDLVQLQMTQRFGDPFWRVKRLFSCLSSRETTIKQCIAYINTFAQEAIQARRAEINTHRNRDLLSRRIMDAEQKGEEVTDKELRDLLINFLLAGRDTTACLLSWSMYELCLHPEILEKVLEEIKETDKQFPSGVGAISDSKLMYQRTTAMVYTEAVLNETLRLHPSVPADTKESIDADVLPDGTHIPPNTTIVYRPYLFGHSKALWGEDAEEFMPERWLGEEKHSQYKFISFNAGQRLCLGKHLALLEARVLLRQILPKFKFVLPENHRDDICYQRNIILNMKNGFNIFVEKRE